MYVGTSVGLADGRVLGATEGNNVGLPAVYEGEHVGDSVG